MTHRQEYGQQFTFSQNNHIVLFNCFYLHKNSAPYWPCRGGLRANGQRNQFVIVQDQTLYDGRDGFLAGNTEAREMKLKMAFVH